MPIRVVLERGPKGKKFVAFAVDWPGWSRGAKTVDGALETLGAYRERYRPVAVRAGLGQAPYRSAYLEAMRAYQRGEVKRAMRSWTLAFLVRHSAFHTMDHAWEMEDKDLSGEVGETAAG